MIYFNSNMKNRNNIKTQQICVHFSSKIKRTKNKFRASQSLIFFQLDLRNYNTQTFKMVPETKQLIFHAIDPITIPAWCRYCQYFGSIRPPLQ